VYSEGFDAGSANHGGGADDEFATLVLDERFVRAALIHEPSARERQAALLDAAGFGSAYPRGSRRPRSRGPFGRGRHQAAPLRWQRTVAQVMLVVLGMLAMLVAAAAVYRGGGTERQPGQSPASTASTSSGSTASGSTAADPSAGRASAVRTASASGAAAVAVPAGAAAVQG